MKVGDAISHVATPIAGALGLDCYDSKTRDLKPESPCAQRRKMLNEGRYADAFFDVFWPQPKEKNNAVDN